ncbi:MAG: FMN-binding negative transcriptional regulator [Acidobacteriota bacterium]
MYIPKANEETRLPVLHAHIRAHPFATLITMGATSLTATHLPLVLEDDGSDFGLLKGHISRANPQHKDLNPSVEALAIFAGDHHYITPNWYPSKHETGKQVPTWNYAVTHAYGPLRLVEDPHWLLAHLTSLTNIHEASFPQPWHVDDAPPDFIQQMLHGIIGLELPIRKLEGKWKISQNRTPQDREGVKQGLSQLDTPESLAMKSLMDKL